MADSRFYAPSGWAGASDAIGALLEKRSLEQDQKRREAIVNKREQDRIDLEWKRLLESDKDRDENRRLTEENRKYTRLQNYVGGDSPEGPADQEMYDTAKEFGLSGKFQMGQPQQGKRLEDDEQGIPQYEVTPGVLQFKGGDRYLAARQTAKDREDAARAAAAERERAAQEAQTWRDKDREDRQAETAVQNNLNRGVRSELQGVQAGLAQTREDAIKADQARKDQLQEDKYVAQDAATIAGRQAIKDRAQRVMNVIGQLGEIDKKNYNTVTKLRAGTERLYGMPIVGRTPEFMRFGEVANADAAMKNLLGTAVVDLLNEMKNQSKTGATGMGALSGPELELLENSASMLKNPNIDSQVVINELNHILGKAKQAYDQAGAPYKPLAGRGPAGSAPAPGAGPRVRKFNPATGQVE